MKNAAKGAMLLAAAVMLMGQGAAPAPDTPPPPAPEAAPAPGPAPVPTAPPVAAPVSAPATAPAPHAEAPPPPPTQQELIYRGEATSILGRTVRDPQDEPIGRIVDVLVDDAGLPRAAVIDVGGFMGMGTRRIAVAWRALHFDMSKGVGRITAELKLDQIKDTPDYKRPTPTNDTPVTIAAPPAKP